MENNSKMKIEISFSERELIIEAHILFSDLNFDSIEFSLNQSFSIEKILSGGKELSYNVYGPMDDEFRLPLSRIVVKDTARIQELKIKYKGDIDSVTCRTCVIQKDFISLNWYSSWYPQDISVPVCDDEVVVRGMEDYLLVKGEFNAVTGNWVYGGKGFDPYNLVLFHREKVCVAESSDLTVFGAKGYVENFAERLCELYSGICSFYNGGLFPQIDMPHLDIVSASPYIEKPGGYKREGLLWFAAMEDENMLKPLIAHEIAHTWCTGANTDTWEDWLNETTAEWAALLYLKSTGEDEIFDKLISMHKEAEDSFLPIKTKDEIRPPDVHHKGVMLFLDIYRKYGYAVVSRLLRIFADIPVKSTSEYLQAIKQAELLRVAEHIEMEICK